MRVAVVTGASTGIGEAVARALAGRGWRCVLLARREGLLEALATEIGGEWERCDVADRAEVEELAARIMARHPKVDLLVNNAGMPGRKPFLEIDPDRIETVMRVNYLGSVWCLRAFVPALEKAHGHVVNMVSVAGMIGLPGGGAYSASKHAQLAFSRAVTAELRPRGIRVHTVCPGFVESEGFPQRGVLRPRILQRFVLDPEDIARHVLHVLDKDKRETVVPRWYRIAPIGQALLPGVVARVGSRVGSRQVPE